MMTTPTATARPTTTLTTTRTAATAPTAAVPSNAPLAERLLRSGIAFGIRCGVGLAAAVGLLGLLPVTAALAFADRPAVPDRPATAVERAIAALTGPDPMHALDELPAGFRDRFGYEPAVVNGRPLNPHGDCSSPVALPDRFTDACRAHDFGYDLLRFAAATGRPAGPWARTALDRTLIEDMHATCDDAVCDAAAETARIGLAVNTWRQRSGVPESESNARIATTYLTRTLEATGLS